MTEYPFIKSFAESLEVLESSTAKKVQKILFDIIEKLDKSAEQETKENDPW